MTKRKALPDCQAIHLSPGDKMSLISGPPEMTFVDIGLHTGLVYCRWFTGASEARVRASGGNVSLPAFSASVGTQAQVMPACALTATTVMRAPPEFNFTVSPTWNCGAAMILTPGGRCPPGDRGE
jgi:uncharacterized protein YodC (DUF2158 family)